MNTLHRYGLIVALFTALLGCRAAGVSWQPLAPGMALGRLTWQETAVTAVRAEPGKCTIRAVYRKEGAGAGEVCPKRGAAINASFFDDQFAPVGLLIVDGKTLHRQVRSNGYGLFLLRRGRPAIVLANTPAPAGVTQAIECKPRLVIDGAIPRFKAQPATRRSAVGIDAHGRVLLAASAGGLTLEQWAACLRDGLGCANALNLDGGPSTQLTARGSSNAKIPGAAVPVFLTIY